MEKVDFGNVSFVGMDTETLLLDERLLLSDLIGRLMRCFNAMQMRMPFQLKG